MGDAGERRRKHEYSLQTAWLTQGVYPRPIPWLTDTFVENVLSADALLQRTAARGSGTSLSATRTTLCGSAQNVTA